MIAVLLLAACVPLATCSPAITTNCATPTPTIKWQHADVAITSIYRVIWRRVGDIEWRGLYDLPIWTETVADAPLARYPGVAIDIPIPRLLPVSEQLVDIEIAIMAVGLDGVESQPSSSIIICMPALCKLSGPCS